MGPRAVVSAGDPLAAAVSLEVLVGGGNAVDAVLAGAMAQCVVEPPWCSIGGDAFMLVTAPGERPVALNGSGAAPSGTSDAVGDGARVPRFGPLSVGTPGFVAAWFAAHGRFATRPAAELIAPAVHLARTGFPLDRSIATAFARIEKGLDAQERIGLEPLIRGNHCLPGQLFRQPELAASLEAIAAGGADEFYRGALARRIVSGLGRRGGVLALSDLDAHEAAFVEPMRISYHGHTVLANPPVSLGVVFLEELKIAEGFELGNFPLESAELIDRMLWCKRAAFADAVRLSDPAGAGAFDPSMLLAEERAKRWRDAYAPGSGRRRLPALEVEGGTDTTSIAVADARGTTAVLIHSVFNEFGSREVVEGTGVLMNDRLAGLAVDPSLPNGLKSGRRPVHTLNSYLVLDEDGQVLLAGATPGGRGQVQTNFQVVTAVLDFGLDLQSALELPRWLSGTPRTPFPDDALFLESEFAPEVMESLREQGHDVSVVDSREEQGSSDLFGGCTVVGREPSSGALQTAPDPRRRVSTLAW